MSINWTSIWEKALEIGPGILADVFADKEPCLTNLN